jgi:hypothetical protein
VLMHIEAGRLMGQIELRRYSPTGGRGRRAT